MQVATAYLLNLTLVLPKMYTGFDYFSAFVAQSEKDISYDPQAMHKVDMEFFFDAEHFMRTLQPLVRVVPELPRYLQTSDHGQRLAPVSLDPVKQESLDTFKLWLRDRDVLRLRCILTSMRWSTQVGTRMAWHASSFPHPSMEVARTHACTPWPA